MTRAWPPGCVASAGLPLASLYMKYSPMAAPAMGAMYCMGAESAAVAATMTVLSRTPWAFSAALDGGDGGSLLANRT